MGSGFQVKFGSYRNILRNNVCFNTNSPCILLYDDFDKGANIVEGNAIINTVADSGIQVAAGAIIRNNIVIGSFGSGITITNDPLDIYNNEGNRNLTIEHNTFVNNQKYGIDFTSTPTNTFVLNNVALGNTQGDFSSTAQNGVVWENNAYNSGSVPSGVSANGTIQVGTASAELTSPSTYNVYPLSSSKLINAGAPLLLPYDFNYFARNCKTPTIGAYEYSSSSNPGWTVQKGFKVVNGTVSPCFYGNPCTSCGSSTSTSTTGTNTGSGTGTNIGSGTGTNTGSSTGTVTSSSTGTITSSSTTSTTSSSPPSPLPFLLLILFTLLPLFF